MVRIEFRIPERDVRRIDRSLLVGLSEPSKVERMAKKHMRKGVRPSDTSHNILVPSYCFQAALAKGTNTIPWIPEGDIRFNKQLMAAVSEPSSDTELPYRE